MRIAVFIKSTTFHAGYGGLETQNKVLCEGLAKRGHEITIYSPKRELSQTEENQNNVKYKFIPCSYRLLFGFSHLDKNNWINRSFEEFHKDHKNKPFDVVLGQSSAALGIIKRKDELNIPVISISHGTILGEYKTRLKSLKGLKDFIKLIKDTIFVLHNFFFRQREFVLHSNKIIAVSHAVKRALIDETFIPEDRVVVIHNGIDVSEFSQVQTKTESNRDLELVYVGRIDASKGLQVLVKALADQQLLNVRLNVIGDGPYLTQLKEIIQNLGVFDRFIFHGKLSHEEVLSKLSQYDVFILPSLRIEGFPMTIPEAMFSGLPTIVSDLGGLPEAVEEGKTGYIAPPNNVEVLKEKILAFLNNPKLRTEMGSNAKIKAQNEFTLEIMLDKYEKVIKEVLQ